jgi:hypothetical protein
MIGHVRLLDDPSQLSQLSEDELIRGMEELKGRSDQFESQRLQEVVVSFGCGLATFVVLGALMQRARSRTENAEYTSMNSATNVAVE